MLAWSLLGALVGAVLAWGAYIGLYDALTGTRGVPARQLPRAFWRWSAGIAVVGALIGAASVWRTLGGP